VSALVVLGNPVAPPHLPLAASPPRLHLLPGNPPLVFAVEGSRLFAVTPDFFEALAGNDEAVIQQMLGTVPAATEQRSRRLEPPAALSLNIAQTCNVSCSYCYAGEGRFGSKAAMMSREIAEEAARQLIENAAAPTISVGFIGGEPFLNRAVLHSTVKYAKAAAAARRKKIRFSVTTNATLLNEADIALLRDHQFAVSVSLDGGALRNDSLRRLRGGSSFAVAMQALRPLLANPGGARIAARSTITRQDLAVAERVEELTACGFAEVGVSPVRSSPDPSLALRGEDWDVFRREMVRAAEAQRARLLRGETPTFSNLATALKQLHAGYCKPLPCGSAASYISLSARGEYFTCHRTIDDRRFALGSLETGVSDSARQEFLRARHVDLQEPCASCWARYLCGGGCHAEVLSAGRSGCDFIRGWLEYCIRLYDEMLPCTTNWIEGGLPQ
jgi:uncharacterized protein